MNERPLSLSLDSGNYSNDTHTHILFGAIYHKGLFLRAYSVFTLTFYIYMQYIQYNMYCIFFSSSGDLWYIRDFTQEYAKNNPKNNKQTLWGGTGKFKPPPKAIKSFLSLRSSKSLSLNHKLRFYLLHYISSVYRCHSFHFSVRIEDLPFTSFRSFSFFLFAWQ